MMAAPIWQPGTVYIPGDIVQPVSGTPAVGQLIVNPNFSGNATGWTLPAQFSYDGTTTFDAGTGSVRFNTVGNGFFSFAATAPVAVLPGTSIRATCMFQQGASDSGNLAGTVNLFWYDSGDVLIGDSAGGIINSGSGGQWHQSVVTAVAPAGAAFVRIGASANRVAQNLPAWFDHFTWNYVSEGVPEGLVYKAVQPASGVSGSQEPVWPSVLGVQVVDNTVTWEAIAATRVTWEASPAMVSGGSEPVWPTQIGGSVADGSVKWTAFSRRVEDVNCPNSKVVAIVQSKVFAADGDIVRFCATANPLDWTTERDAGYLPTGLQQANANDMAVLNQYRSNLVAFNASSFQNWQADPDPEVMAILDQMDGVGSTWQQAARPVGNELFYLSQLGVRTVGIAGASTNLQAGDVGMPIDPLVQEAVSIATANGSKVLATYYPSAGQYWLTFSDNPPSGVFISGSLPDGDINNATSYQYTVGGGVAPRVVTLVSGSLPTGLSISTSGLVTGTRTVAGVFSFRLKVTDAIGNETFLDDQSETLSDPLWLQVLSLIQNPAAVPPIDAKPPLWGFNNVFPTQRPSLEVGGGRFGGNALRFTDLGSGNSSILFTATASGGQTQANLTSPLRSNYTVEVMVKPDSTSGNEVLFALGTFGTNDLEVRRAGAQYAVSTTSGGVNFIIGGAAVAGQWQHVAITRTAAGNVILFVNGAVIGQVARPEQLGSVFTYGSQANTNLPFNGLLDMMRITGVARYTAAFTPPTGLFPNG